jgi:Tol biopolymer transport system component
MASNGRVGFVGDTPLGGGISHVAPTLYVDDREISRDIRPFATAVYGNNIQNYVVFSPDGTKYAYSKVVPGGVAAVIDGKVWRTYDGIGLTEFSPDSKHAFSVGTRGQSFVTVDGKEMAGINRLDNFIFSPDGTRFAYEAYTQDGNHVVIDGKESPRYYNIIARSLSFSPDSRHYIYGACTNIMKCEVVQDGNVSNVPGLSAFSARTLRPVYIFPPAFFSPDSNQVAYAYSKSDGTSQTVYFVNGKEIVHGTSFEFPSFSPDSKHFVVMGWNGHGYSFFADGKTGPGYQELLEANLNIARFEKPETYRFLGVKDDGVYRVTIDLASTN